MYKKILISSLFLLFIGQMTQAEDFNAFVNSLRTCAPYDSTFVHPMSGEQMRRKIYGQSNGKCLYKERMPGNTVMECNYPMTVLPSIANYYSNSTKSKSTKVELSTESQSSSFLDYCDMKPNGK